jgi:hypothetical protein
MTQNQLNRLIADATGEDIDDIRQRGFSLADPLEVNFDSEPCDLPPQVVDWDEVDLQHNVAIVPQR